MSPDSTIMRGEIIGADFADRDDGRIVMHVAVDAEHSVSRRQVTVIDTDYFEPTLPTADEVRGILSPREVPPCDVDYYTWMTTPVNAACPKCDHVVLCHTMKDHVCAVCVFMAAPHTVIGQKPAQ